MWRLLSSFIFFTQVTKLVSCHYKTDTNPGSPVVIMGSFQSCMMFSRSNSLILINVLQTQICKRGQWVAFKLAACHLGSRIKSYTCCLFWEYLLPAPIPSLSLPPLLPWAKASWLHCCTLANLWIILLAEGNFKKWEWNNSLSIVSGLPKKYFYFSLFQYFRYFKMYSMCYLWYFFKMFNPSFSGFRPPQCSSKTSSCPFVTVFTFMSLFPFLSLPLIIGICKRSSCKGIVISIVTSPLHSLELWP